MDIRSLGSDFDVLLSVDLMGGGSAYIDALSAVVDACKQDKKLFFILFGTDSARRSIVSNANIPNDRHIFVESRRFVEDTAKPIEAIKKGEGSSMKASIDAVRDNKAHACVSFGNTGVLMVLAKHSLGTIKGVKRPAIAGIFPTLNGNSVLLDMGANTDCNELMIFQFALMGVCFAKSILNIESPTVGLINVGEEDGKGRALERSSKQLLENSGLRFIGYVEANRITDGVADVIVADGFSGNLILKASEGAASMFMKLFKQACQVNLRSRLGALLLRPELETKFNIVDPSLNNGAMFIGLNGIVVKGHGNSDKEGMLNAIKVAATLVRSGVNLSLQHELRKLEEIGVGLNIIDKLKATSAKILKGINDKI